MFFGLGKYSSNTVFQKYPVWLMNEHVYYSVTLRLWKTSFFVPFYCFSMSFIFFIFSRPVLLTDTCCWNLLTVSSPFSQFSSTIPTITSTLGLTSFLFCPSSKNPHFRTGERFNYMEGLIQAALPKHRVTERTRTSWRREWSHPRFPGTGFWQPALPPGLHNPHPCTFVHFLVTSQ